MKDHTQFTPSTSFSLAIIGEPFTRKTSVAFRFPKPLIWDCDRKLASVVDYYPEARPFWFIEPDLGPDGKELPPAMKWPMLVNNFKTWALKPEPRTLVFDSVTRVAEYLQDYIISQGGPTKPLIVGGESVMTQQMWYPFKNLLQAWVVQVRALGKPCIFTFHEKLDKDEVSGAITRRPAISGQLSDTICKLFTDVWRTSIKQVPVDASHPAGVAYVIRTEPTNMMSQLGHSRPLPAEFEFDWNIIAKAYPFLSV